MVSNVLHLCGSYNTFLSQNLLSSNLPGQDNSGYQAPWSSPMITKYLVYETRYFVIMGLDLSGLIIILLSQSYISPVLHLLGFDSVSFPSHKKIYFMLFLPTNFQHFFVKQRKWNVFFWERKEVGISENYNL